MTLKPASKLIAKAVPRGGRFAAQFALPGLVPVLARRKGGEVELVDSEREAEVLAMEAVIRLYHSRTVDTRKAGGYRRMTGAELAVALNAANITPTYFAELYGVPQSRVVKWLDGEQDTPHSAHVLVKVMAYSDEVFNLIESITEEAQNE